MKRALLLAAPLAVCIFLGCGQGSGHEQLARVDSLVLHYETDSAVACLLRIDRSRLTDEADQAYYDILKVEQVVQSPVDIPRFDVPLDSVLRRCMTYYQHTDDSRNLARTYLYYGKHLMERQHNYRQASVYLKQAENLLPAIHDVRLAYQTYEALATLNYYSRNTDLALRYSYQMLSCARQSSNTHMMTYACNHLAVLYMEQGQQDSISKCIGKSLSMLRQMPPKDRAYAMTNLGAVFMSNHQADSAKYYYSKAYDEYPLNFINQYLASIYYAEGDRQRADDLWDKALRTDNLHDKVETYRSIISKKYDGGDYQAVSDAALTLLDLKDSLVRQQQTAEVQEIQLKYDQEKERRKLDRVVITALVVLLLLLLVIAAIIAYHVNKTSKARQKIMRDQILINDYYRQIEELQRSGKHAAKDIDSLKHKMQALGTELTAQLFEGHALYQKIVQGSSVATWTKEDFIRFNEYYKVVNLPFVMQIENDYIRLSPGNKFFLILQDMQKTDEEIAAILGVTDGALRTARSRLRGKLRKD